MVEKKGFTLALVAAIILCAAWGMPLKGFTQADNGVSTAPNPVEYDIEDLQGSVQVLEEGSKDWEPAQEGQVVDSGDEVKVGDNSQATLMMQEDTSVHLNANTDIKVEQIEANETGGFLSHLQLFAGNILADVKKHLEESHSAFEVESSGVVCGVRGTAFEVTSQGGTAQVATHEGAVAVGNGTESHMVEAGNFSEFQKGKFHLQRKLDQKEIARFQKWREFRKQVFKKRLQRLEDIRTHKRAAWVRKHPRLEKAILKHKIQQKVQERRKRREKK